MMETWYVPTANYQWRSVKFRLPFAVIVKLGDLFLTSFVYILCWLSRCSLSAVTNTIRSMKVGEASGVDGISVEMLRENDMIASLLCRLFNTSWKSSK